VFGAHRFYLGKIVTGILMILTLGGFFIWALIDLLILIFSVSKDAKGRPLVGKSAVLSVALGVLVLLNVFVVLAVAIPQYGIYRRSAQDNVTQSAYHAIAMAEEAYFAYNGRYTEDYNILRNQTGLVFDHRVEYSTIDVNGVCFKFRVRYIAQESTLYDYDSCREKTVTIIY
jgi:hypothetical protein